MQNEERSNVLENKVNKMKQTISTLLLVCLLVAASRATATPVEVSFGDNQTWVGETGWLVTVVEKRGPNKTVDYSGELSRVTPTYIVVDGCFVFISDIVSIGSASEEKEGNVSRDGNSTTGDINDEITSLVSNIQIFCDCIFESGDIDWEITSVLQQKENGKSRLVLRPSNAMKKGGTWKLDAIKVKFTVSKGSKELTLRVGAENPLPLVAILQNGALDMSLVNVGLPKNLSLSVESKRNAFQNATIKGAFTLAPRGSSRGNDERWNVNGISKEILEKVFRDAKPKLIEKIAKDVNILLVLDESTVVLTKIIARNKQLWLEPLSSESLEECGVLPSELKEKALDVAHTISSFNACKQVEKIDSIKVSISNNWSDYSVVSRGTFRASLPCLHCSLRPLPYSFSYDIRDQRRLYPTKCSGCRHVEACDGNADRCTACELRVSRSHSITKEESDAFQSMMATQIANPYSGTVTEISMPCFSHKPRSRTKIKRTWKAKALLSIALPHKLLGACIGTSVEGVYEPSNNKSTTQNGRRVVEVFMVGTEELYPKEESANPKRPAYKLFDENNSVVGGPNSWIDGTRFVFMNEDGELRAFTYNSNKQTLESADLVYSEWLSVQEGILNFETSE